MSLLYFVCGLILVGLGVYAWNRPATTGARLFGILVFSAAIHSLGYALELASPNLDTALFWSKVQYVGILSFPTIYLLFILRYIGRTKLEPRLMFFLVAWPVFVYAAKLADGNLGWIYSSTAMVQVNSMNLLSFTRGPLYYLSNAYTVVIVTYANYLLFRKMRTSSGLYQRQTALMFWGATMVYLVFVYYLLGYPLPTFLQGLDINPLAYTIWAACINLAIFQYHFLDLAPIAREALIEMLSDGVVVLDAQARVVDANPEARHIFGWIQLPVGQTAQEAMGGSLDLAFLPSLEKSTKRETSLVRDPARAFYETTFSVLRTEHGIKIGYLVLIHDITDRKEFERELEGLSLQDELTGLANRRGFNVLASQALSMAGRMHLNVTIFYVDIDGLKWVNDNLGHAVGDEAIKDVALILRSAFRTSDIIARIGGDEFTVLAFESDRNSSEIMQRHLQEAITKYSKLARPYRLSFSTGLTHFRWNRPKPLDDLLVAADRAMYKEKRAKKGKKTASSKSKTSKK